MQYAQVNTFPAPGLIQSGRIPSWELCVKSSSAQHLCLRMFSPWSRGHFPSPHKLGLVIKRGARQCEHKWTCADSQLFSSDEPTLLCLLDTEQMEKQRNSSVTVTLTATYDQKRLDFKTTPVWDIHREREREREIDIDIGIYTYRDRYMACLIFLLFLYPFLLMFPYFS